MRHLVRGFVIAALLISFVPVNAQEPAPRQDGQGNTIIRATSKSDYTRPKISEELEKDRKYAFELWNDHKDLEALPWFEKLAVAVPNDAQILEGLAVCLLSHSTTAPNPEQEKAEQVRVRQLLLQSQKLGYSSDLQETLLSMIPEDGSPAVFSKDAEVDKIMKRAEANFSSGKLDDAKAGYLQVLLIEPNNYMAALFIGDVYFVKKDYASAGEWFTRTIAIDPDRETAYRYWGDALSAQGKLAEARKKYIEAVVAEPYKRASWNGINKWTQYTKSQLTWYKIQSPNSHEVKDQGHINININPGSLGKNDGSLAWMMYEMSRALWSGEKFKKEFPNEKEYRHSLKEETEALGLAASSAESSQKDKNAKLTDDLKQLISLKKAGFVEAYILFNAADEGIAQDYDGYRKDHRDKLFQYLSEIVVPAVPKGSN